MKKLNPEFLSHYQNMPEYGFFCPGRVNLIGEHIDYNGGLVMPAAISQGTYIWARLNHEGLFRFKSLNFSETLDISAIEEYSKTDKHWYDYPMGVLLLFKKMGYEIGGLDLLFYGDLPIGAGLSSSASIEVAMAYCLNVVFKAGKENLELVKLAKRVENEFIGVNCGIIDQFAVAFGEKDQVLMLDCDSLDYQAAVVNNKNVFDYGLTGF